LCETLDERERWREALDQLGPLQTEPIVTPVGAVVGERTVLNPAEAALRRCERQIDTLRTALGLTPASRARLGLQHLAVVERAERILDGRRKDSHG
jgi:hypothetical protein